MFYRRKIMLALLEAFGGSLTKNDCQKLLFLFCLRREKNYYDFFPYQYGNYSLLVHQDWNRLIDLGYLMKGQDFQLKDTKSHLPQIQSEDSYVLGLLVNEVGSLRGEQLIRKVYLEYPYFASRSEIAKKILNDEEYFLVKSKRNTDKNVCLFTIGYEGLSIDAYLNMLLANNIFALVDVRKNPLSMKYGFSKRKFSEAIEQAGLSYFHIPELGVPSELRHDLKDAAAYKDLFDIYASNILPSNIISLNRLKSILVSHNRVAITCFEADYHFCHRHKIAEYFEKEPSSNIPVIHLQKDCTHGTPLMYTNNKSHVQNTFSG